jgi:D-alanyl-lipoteichoic acid acyltransferase DltB (MBOAT superfamily)
MVFNSITFLVFLTITLTLYYRLGHKGQNWLLLGASYIFYGWWDYRFAFLLLATSILDYWLALRIDESRNAKSRKFFLISSISANMGVLCIFKYFNFFMESLKTVLETVGLHPSFPILHLLLPVGISFYTFLSMSYTIDVYRGEMKAARNPIDFLLYVSFFPHLVAGPIVRASYLLPQCQSVRLIKSVEIENGAWLMLVGYVKKVVIADQLAPIVNWGFSQPFPPFTDVNAWLIVYAFAFQIYGDFSGYSDIARGLAKLMGFELVENFRKPYLVSNPSEFWRNWHISLSTWLRDYLYIPLGGNRKGPIKTYRNLIITMVLGGLWHGAGAAYLLWGVYHGGLLAVHRWWSGKLPRKIETEPAPAMTVSIVPFSRVRLKFLMIFIFFQITCIGWLIFRAGAVTHFSQIGVVTAYLKAMFSFHFNGVSPLTQGLVLLGGLALLLQWRCEWMDHFQRWRPAWKIFGCCVALALITTLGIFEGSEFIYFKF